MTGVLLIGFDYHHLQGEQTLSGVVKDLERVYRFTEKISPDRQLIVSDLDYHDLEQKDFYDSSNLDFLQKVDITPISDNFELKRSIYHLVRGLDRLFIYYTGHASQEGFHLSLRSKINLVDYLTMTKPSQEEGRSKREDFPEEGRIPPDQEELFKAFRAENTNNQLTSQKQFHKFDRGFLKYSEMGYLLKETNPGAEIILLMDCCSGDSFGLPFVLNRNSRLFKLRKEKIEIPSQKIVAISSSLKHQSSLSYLKGSLFTTEMFSKLEKMALTGDIRYSRLIDEVGIDKLNSYFQTLNIYSSRPDLTYLWHWIFGPSQYKIEEDGGIIKITPYQGISSRK